MGSAWGAGMVLARAEVSPERDGPEMSAEVAVAAITLPNPGWDAKDYIWDNRLIGFHKDARTPYNTRTLERTWTWDSSKLTGYWYVCLYPWHSASGTYGWGGCTNYDQFG